MSERRSTRWIVGCGLVLLLVAGAVAVLFRFVLPLLLKPSDPAACLEPVEDLGLAVSVTSRPLPPLEVVSVDLPTTYREGDWRCWSSGALPVNQVALEPDENTIWLTIGMDDLIRWDLNRLEPGPVPLALSGWRTGVAVAGPGQVLVLGKGQAAFYDRGRWTTAPLDGDEFFSPVAVSGVDPSGAVWVRGDERGSGWSRCGSDAGSWTCVRGTFQPEPWPDHFAACGSQVGSLPLPSLWDCLTRNRRETWVPINPPACDQWAFFSGSARCVTWDRDCAGQLVLLSQDPRRIERTLPWPGIDVDQIRWVTANRRQVWVLADGLWVYQGGQWIRFPWWPPYSLPTRLAADPTRDGVWASVPGLGLVYVSPDGMRLYHPGDRLYNIPIYRGYPVPHWRGSPWGEGLAVTALAETTDGRIWAGTDGGGLWVLDETAQVWQPTGIDQSFVNVLLADPAGGLWVGTRLGGVTHYDGPGDRKWWRIPDGLPVDVVVDLAYDGRGRLWAATRDGQVSLFDGRRWQVMDEGTVVKKSPVEPAQGNPWYRRPRVDQWTAPEMWPSGYYLDVLQDSRGRWWMAGESWVCLYEGTED